MADHTPAPSHSTLSGAVRLVLPEFDAPPADPIGLLREWLIAADRHGVREAGAFVLATSDERGRPSGRVVLVKSVDERGLVFSTHVGSRKGREIAGTGWVSCVFHWRETLQQIIVSGRAERLSGTESDELFEERPRPPGRPLWRPARATLSTTRGHCAPRRPASPRGTIRCAALRAGAVMSSVPTGSSSGSGPPTGCTAGWNTASAAGAGPRGDCSRDRRVAAGARDLPARPGRAG
jgi:hypothetical protein